jgi:hypothetical protein
MLAQERAQVVSRNARQHDDYGDSEDERMFEEIQEIPESEELFTV